MQFQVPQFIETEDRIIGPLTLKQFFYIAAGGGLSFALFFTLQTFLWLLVTVIIFTVSLSFAFIKINGQSFFTVAVAAFNFYWHPRFYLWQREEKAIEDYSALEKRHLEDKDYDIVLVGADNINDLKKAYPSYFLDIEEFLRYLNRIISQHI